jgi:hypothetical protein
MSPSRLKIREKGGFSGPERSAAIGHGDEQEMQLLQVFQLAEISVEKVKRDKY